MATDGGDWKQMFQAACDGDLDLLGAYLRSGVDPNYAHPEYLSTPLVAALVAGQAGSARLLLRHGALPDLHSEFEGLRPVEAARAAGLHELEAELLARGAKPPAAKPIPAPRPWWRRLFET
jgi:uncharacterized protein